MQRKHRQGGIGEAVSAQKNHRIRADGERNNKYY